MGGTIPRERWGKSMMECNMDSENSESEIIEQPSIIQTQPSDQQSFVYQKFNIDQNFPNWLKEMYIKHGAYQSNEKLQLEEQCYFNQQESDGYIFFQGFMQAEQKHGYGIMLKDEQFYEGSFQYDIKCGWGRQMEQNLLMQGYWQNNQIVRDLEIKKVNEKYFGQCLNGKPHGKGKLKFEEEDEIYEGDFVNGIREGKGILINLIYNCQYDGDFKNDKLEGKGIFIFDNGQEYEGEFQNNQMNGKGYMKYLDGRFYKGDFLENKQHGKGIMKDKDGIYEGEFENGQKHGFGRMKLNNKNELFGKWENGVLKEKGE
ncbi:unnamed protein product [Paramecium sonneborni]|uniref:MORN repeat protein n=1 Tax=Paramecium sonneborni TaxID=65129 RepID=A0A8S1LGF4_9CILI|nr:unnamed protein product [Paramecium sonneborni]